MATSREHPYIAKLRGYLGEGRIGRREFLRTATLLGLSASAASIMVGGGPIREARAALPKGGTLKIGKKIFEVTNPHIFKWHSQANVCAQVCQYLARTGHDNITRPHLLERWEPSADLKTWTLHVRKGVTWRNGREFTADDAIWNLQHVLDPETGSSALGLMKGYMLEEYTDDSGNKTTRLWDANAIERIDSHTLRLNLKAAQLALPEHLYHYPIAMLDPEENGIFGVGSNGTGAFELVEYEVQKRGRLVARSDYWGEGPWLDAIEIVDLGDDPAAGIGALASNQVHGLEEASNHQLEALQQMAHLQLHSVTSAGTGVVRGKCTQPPFNDLRVRKALRLATDPGPVIEGAVRGLGTEAEHHHVCPIHPEYAELPAMGQHPEEAKRLLAEAGYGEGLEFEITARDTDWVKQAVQILVEQWKASNIQAKINIVPLALWGELWDKAPVTYTTWGHRPLGVMVLGLAYRSGVPWNESEYSNSDFDRILTEAEGTFDLEDRRALTAELEKIMQEDGPIAQPLWRNVFTFMDKRVQGFRMHPSTFMYGEELGLEA